MSVYNALREQSRLSAHAVHFPSRYSLRELSRHFFQFQRQFQSEFDFELCFLNRSCILGVHVCVCSADFVCSVAYFVCGM